MIRRSVITYLKREVPQFLVIAIAESISSK